MTTVTAILQAERPENVAARVRLLDEATRADLRRAVQQELRARKGER